ncbi:zinc-binding dehydrogenase [Streptosporangium canum]|uniref:zinc-binding dehydrogenase n=1 Tax=Streptosporangium canum TaxID=324952 RepID=UPI0033B09C08
MSIRALVADPAAPAALRLEDVDGPVPRPHQVVIDVRHISLNRGEIAAAPRLAPGTVHGYDASGIVSQAAADGSGPTVGTRVVAFGTGAWAQRMAVDADSVAEVPAEVDLADAAALPMAGVTALRTLRAVPILGRRVLITGAAGGVGRFAVQLAALGGAHVIASVGSAARGKGLAEIGAHEVVIGLEGVDRPVDLILDNVGGSQLVAAWALLAPGGNIQNIGWASDEPAVFAPYSLFSLGASKSINSFGDATRFGEDLSILLSFVADGRLRPEVGWRGPWERIADAARELLDRRIPGKAVLDVSPLRGERPVENG